MKRNGTGRKTSANGRGDRVLSRPVASTWATDPPEFRERVQEAARERMGVRLDEVELDPESREMFYDVFATMLRTPPKPIPPETMEMVERLRAAGLHVTPGHGDLSHRKPLDIPGISLTDAVLEERYGAEYVPPRRRRTNDAAD
jgi:hypothetical protein